MVNFQDCLHKPRQFGAPHQTRNYYRCVYLVLIKYLVFCIKDKSLIRTLPVCGSLQSDSLYTAGDPVAMLEPFAKEFYMLLATEPVTSSALHYVGEDVL